MKILDVSEFYAEDGGGVKTYVDQKFAAAKIAGHELVVVAPAREDKVTQRSGGKIVWVKCPVIPFDHRYHVFWDQKPIDDIVAAERPDFIEGSSPWRGGWVAARQPRRIPRALVFHQDPVLSYPHVVLRNRVAPDVIDRSFRWFFRYMTKLQSHYDVSVVSSGWLADRLAQHGLVRPSVVPFGIERAHFAGARPSAYLRRAMIAECGVDDPQATLFFSVSRLHPEKRVSMMLEAFRKASQAAPMALYHVGDGPYRSRVEAVAATVSGAKIAGAIRDREQIATMYASADCYLHACSNETFGMTIAESMAAGAPVVAPRAGAACDLIDPAFAISFPADNVDAMAEAMLRFTRTDRDWRVAARLAARAKSPSIDEHFRKLFTLYEKIVDARSDRVPDHRRVGDGSPRLEKVA